MLSLVSHGLGGFATVIKMASAILEETEVSPSSDQVMAYASSRKTPIKSLKPFNPLSIWPALNPGALKIIRRRFYCGPLRRQLLMDIRLS
jgi:hypothetical protein